MPTSAAASMVPFGNQRTASLAIPTPNEPGGGGGSEDSSDSTEDTRGGGSDGGGSDGARALAEATVTIIEKQDAESMPKVPVGREVAS